MYMLFDKYTLSMRLEPIMSLDGVTVIGYELLSRPTKSSAEYFFRQLLDEDVWRLAVMQLSKTKAIQKKLKASGQKLFINLRGSSLCSPYYLDQITKIAHCKIAIEIEFEAPFSSYCCRVKNLEAGASELQKNGHELWLDDYELNKNILPEELSNFNFQGVKIDKQSFWTVCKTPCAARTAIDNLKSVIPEVLIEGIENEQQYKLANSFGARYGQGYLWPFVELPS